MIDESCILPQDHLPFCLHLRHGRSRGCLLSVWCILMEAGSADEGIDEDSSVNWSLQVEEAGTSFKP